MKPKILFVFVEGVNDERFVRRVIAPMLEKKYDSIKPLLYAQEIPKNVNKLLIRIKAIGYDYVFFADINKEPCITAKKEKIQNKFNSTDKDKIMVVVKEIESWYLAGLTDIKLQGWKISPFTTTDNITKEQFEHLIPRKFGGKDFMLEILNHYSPKIAKKRNGSFKYFIEKNKLRV